MVKLGEFKFPIIMPDNLTHSEVVGLYTPVSAGDVSIALDVREPVLYVSVSGSSTSLKLKPAEGDAEIIRSFLVDGDTLAMASQSGLDFSFLDPRIFKGKRNGPADLRDAM